MDKWSRTRKARNKICELWLFTEHIRDRKCAILVKYIFIYTKVV